VLNSAVRLLYISTFLVLFAFSFVFPDLWNDSILTQKCGLDFLQLLHKSRLSGSSLLVHIILQIQLYCCFRRGSLLLLHSYSNSWCRGFFQSKLSLTAKRMIFFNFLPQQYKFPYCFMVIPTHILWTYRWIYQAVISEYCLPKLDLSV
jgi:hypothetical protein